MYFVDIEGTFTGVQFKFKNYDDAINFIGMVVEYGTRDGKPIKATMWFEEEAIA